MMFDKLSMIGKKESAGDTTIVIEETEARAPNTVVVEETTVQEPQVTDEAMQDFARWSQEVYALMEGELTAWQQ